jgi:hypothetical protein
MIYTFDCERIDVFLSVCVDDLNVETKKLADMNVYVGNESSPE